MYFFGWTGSKNKLGRSRERNRNILKPDWLGKTSVAGHWSNQNNDWRSVWWVGRGRYSRQNSSFSRKSIYCCKDCGYNRDWQSGKVADWSNRKEDNRIWSSSGSFWKSDICTGKSCQCGSGRIYFPCFISCPIGRNSGIDRSGSYGGNCRNRKAGRIYRNLTGWKRCSDTGGWISAWLCWGNEFLECNNPKAGRRPLEVDWSRWKCGKIQCWNVWQFYP